ncbi:hypothetical protein HPP92_015612 [Vanilla planifolia]|uniref:Uncharacterized protein n=1 Tax=Vanilla planifolia TaxID=51239 RepID=A0A835QDC2_VANPL|nr:hypothetical protein HPP92_015612 [Vanilla planifolia]
MAFGVSDELLGTFVPIMRTVVKGVLVQQAFQIAVSSSLFTFVSGEQRRSNSTSARVLGYRAAVRRGHGGDGYMAILHAQIDARE